MITSNKGQSSMEYLLIVSMALLFIIPTFYFFYSTTQRSTDLAIANQLERLGLEIIATAEKTYSFGRNAKLSVDLNMPPNVKNISIVNEKELVFTVTSAGRDNTLVFFSEVPLFIAPSCIHAEPQTSFGFQFTNPGKKQVRMISCGQNISIWS